jgi:hypothetical protein
MGATWHQCTCICNQLHLRLSRTWQVTQAMTCIVTVIVIVVAAHNGTIIGRRISFPPVLTMTSLRTLCHTFLCVATHDQQGARVIVTATLARPPTHRRGERGLLYISLYISMIHPRCQTCATAASRRRGAGGDTWASSSYSASAPSST